MLDQASVGLGLALAGAWQWECPNRVLVPPALGGYLDSSHMLDIAACRNLDPDHHGPVVAGTVHVAIAVPFWNGCSITSLLQDPATRPWVKMPSKFWRWVACVNDWQNWR